MTSNDRRSSAAAPPVSYRDLTQVDIDLLTGILSHQPPPHSTQLGVYTGFALSQIESLPPHLLRNPGRPRSLTVNFHGFRQPKPEYSCRLHSHLPYRLLRGLYRVFRHDIALSIPESLSGIARINADAATLLQTLRDVSMMFLTDDAYLEAWGVLPPTGPERDRSRWVRQQDGCAACVLARMGGEPTVLRALRAGYLCRLGEANGSVRVRWVEGWMKTSENAEALIEGSGRLGKELRRLKRGEQPAGAKHELRGLHVGDWEKREEDEDDDGVWFAKLVERVERWKLGVELANSEGGFSISSPRKRSHGSSRYSSEYSLQLRPPLS